MDSQETKIAALIAAFDTEHVRAQGAITAIYRAGDQLKQDMSGAAKIAVQVALKELNADIEKASRVLADLQRFSLWRASLQHLVVAVVAMAITLLAVWWYVPPLSEIAVRRAEIERDEASIEDLNKRGAKISLSVCGDKKRLCVAVDEAAGRFGNAKLGERYMIPKGY